MTLTGGFLDYLIVFWAGVLVSFSPCIYPVLPMTASFVAGFNVHGTRLMGLMVSLVYVFGVAITYSAMAVFAALTGGIFGQLQNSPVIWIVVANILIFFALAMSDLMPLPSFGVKIHDRIIHKNLSTVLLFGMASGFVVGPCTAPVLGTLLLYVSSKQNMLHGISLMFVFAYGVGASLILVGTFSGILARLPKSGLWMVRVKQFCGFILIIAAEYFLVKAGGLLF